ncbi:unnamed protein product [Soboliphyme baturini]|uniref:Uncharacterized protein n=1 Tax=Soboliphyme baturini TaxID=241478 RepID=A0A183IAZ1_9BILA|nr:unnamed protein product [Soboliphyme baturini]
MDNGRQLCVGLTDDNDDDKACQLVPPSVPLCPPKISPLQILVLRRRRPSDRCSLCLYAAKVQTAAAAGHTSRESTVTVAATQTNE